jgi:hypothetical protein
MMRSRMSLAEPAAVKPAARSLPPATVPPRAYNLGNQETQKALQKPTTPAAGPRQNGTLEFEGEPRALAIDQPGLNSTGDSVDTHAHRPQFEWPVRVTQKGSTASCLAVGFLQTVISNDVQAEYTAGGRCSFVVNPLPIRDGFAATPVWVQALSARGQGFGLLGTCQTAPPGTLPPALSGVSTQGTVNVSTTDDPGGFFPLQHPSDTQRTLRSIKESLAFHTWLAVRPQQAAEGSVASYTFLRHAQWSVQREMTVTPNSGGAAALLTTNTTKIDLLEDGKGTADPELGSAIANDVVKRDCTIPAAQPRLMEPIP